MRWSGALSLGIRRGRLGCFIALSAVACTGPNPRFVPIPLVLDAGVNDGAGGAEASTVTDAPALSDRAAEVDLPNVIASADAAGVGDALGRDGTGAGDRAALIDVAASGDTQPDVAFDASRFDAPSVSAAGLVAYWKLDDGAGHTTAVDSTPNANHGTLESLDAAQSWVLGKVGKGLQFPHDISAAGLMVPASPSITALRTFTFAAWSYRTTYDANRNMSILSRQSTGDGEVYNLALDRDIPRLWIGSPSGGETASVQGPAIPNALGRWIHVAASYDGLAMRLYIDGGLVATAPYTGGLVASTAPLYVGTNKNPLTYDTPFEGILDEVQVYSVALSVAAIAALAAGASPTP